MAHMSPALRRLISAVGLTLASTTPGLAQSSGPFDLNQTTIDDLLAALRSRRVTCRSVVEHYLRRIDAYDQRGPALNALVTVNPRAIAEAERLDASQQDAVPLRPLHCIPVLVKDAFDTADMRTTYGSAAFSYARAGCHGRRPAQAGRSDRHRQGDPGRVRFWLCRIHLRPIIPSPAKASEWIVGGRGHRGRLRGGWYWRRHRGSVRGPAAVNSLVGLRPTLPLVSRAGSGPSSPATMRLARLLAPSWIRPG